MMKAIGLNLMLAAFFLAPACGLFASNTSKTENKVKNEDPVIAADQIQTPSVGEAPTEEFHFPMLRTLGGLGLVLSLMVAGFFAAKRFFPQYFAKCDSERDLKVIETLSMGDRRSIALIQVANSRFLVGNTPHQINLITTLQEPISLASEIDNSTAQSKSATKKERRSPFRNVFEVEKNRSSQYVGNPLPDEVRTKMRQLREALER